MGYLKGSFSLDVKNTITVFHKKKQYAKYMKLFNAILPHIIFDHLKYFVMFAKKAFLQ